MKTTRILAVLALISLVAGGANAADLVQSPRGAQASAEARTVRGTAEPKAFEYRAGKAAELAGRTSPGKTDRDLVRESRSQLYTGKNAPQRSFEIAPVK